MGWHHRPPDRVRLVYRQPWMPYKNAEGTVLIRARPRGTDGARRAPLNFLVSLDDGRHVIVPGGNLRGVTA